MAIAIILKSNNTSGIVPSAGQMEIGEVAINTADAILYMKYPNSAVGSLTLTGNTGPTGAPGAPGPPGPDGSPGTPGNPYTPPPPVGGGGGGE